MATQTSFSTFELWLRLLALHYPRPVSYASPLSPPLSEAAFDAVVSTADGRHIVLVAIDSLMRALSQAPPKLDGYIASLLRGGSEELDTAALLAFGNTLRARIERRDYKSIDIDANLIYPSCVVLRCANGLADLLGEELAQLGFAATARDSATVAVDLPGRTPLRALYRSRLWRTAALETPLWNDNNRAMSIRHALDKRDVLVNVTRMSPDRPRFRLDGRPAPVVAQLENELSDETGRFLYSSTDPTWVLSVDEQRRTLQLTPMATVDPRFVGRVAAAAVPSDPTIAAALAFVAGNRVGDRVWDPFVGTGTTLIERARLGPCGEFQGSDVDGEALRAARQNLEAAGLEVNLQNTDVLASGRAAVPLDLIITHPPQRDAVELLVGALPVFTARLGPGGRLVWITPVTEQTSPAAERTGLQRVRAIPVVVDGVSATLERWERPKSARFWTDEQDDLLMASLGK